MPHHRKRYAHALIERALKHSPIVGVLGQRQVGKTTLLEKLSDDYRTLDLRAAREEVESDPELFLSNRPSRFAIDEAQYCPSLFPALKDHVRRHPAKGQFLLSGSVRFTSRKAIRESLTGRIATVEVLPLSYSESHSRPLPQFLSDLPRVRTQSQLEDMFEPRAKTLDPSDFERFLEMGGLPGLCFLRAPEVRADRWRSHLDTLLTRDVRLVQETSLPFEALRDLLEFIARNQGAPFVIKDAVKYAQISAPTLRRLLSTFEALFLIRPVRTYGDASRPTFFVEDQGMASWITRSVLSSPQDLIRGLYGNLRQEFSYRPEWNGRILQYRTKHDVEVPLVFDRGPDGGVGFIATLDRTPRPKTLASAKAFLSKNPQHTCVIAYGGSDCVLRMDRLLWVPYWLLLG